MKSSVFSLFNTSARDIQRTLQKISIKFTVTFHYRYNLLAK
jgi:hypothetical protein